MVNRFIFEIANPITELSLLNSIADIYIIYFLSRDIYRYLVNLTLLVCI